MIPVRAGSGKKLKRCHRDAAAAPRPRGPWGRIKAAVIGAERVIVLPGEIIRIPAKRHLHDFLIDFAKNTLGIGRGEAELAKPLPDRHPVMQWFAAAGEQMKAARAGIPDGKLIATEPKRRFSRVPSVRLRPIHGQECRLAIASTAPSAGTDQRVRWRGI